MGCYDMIVAKCVCPYCGKIDKIMLDQTKDFDCSFRNLSLGDLCFHGNGFSSDAGAHECESCKNTYGYAVGYENGVMTDIQVIDSIFNKTYSYFKSSDIKPHEMTETEFKDKVKYLNTLKEILQHNQSKISNLKKIDNNVEDKIKILTTIINSSVANVFK